LASVARQAGLDYLPRERALSERPRTASMPPEIATVAPASVTAARRALDPRWYRRWTE
jgi:hypothetical protein